MSAAKYYPPGHVLPRPVRADFETVSAFKNEVKAWKSAGEPSAIAKMEARMAALPQDGPTAERAMRGLSKRRGPKRPVRLDWDLPGSVCQLYGKGKLNEREMFALERYHRDCQASQGAGGVVRYEERVAGGGSDGSERMRLAQVDAIARRDAARAAMTLAVARVVTTIVAYGSPLGQAIGEDEGFGQVHERRVAARALLKAGAKTLIGHYG